MSYFSLKYANGTSVSSTTDSNGKTIYTLDATENFDTEWFDVDKTSKAITIDVITNGISGSGTLTWKHSRNKTNVFDLINTSGNVASLTVDGSPASDYLVTENYPLGVHRLNWSKGTVTAGTIQILVSR